MDGESISGDGPFYHEELDCPSFDADLQGKLPAVCSGCGAVYQEGRWSWSARPAGSCELLCPACQRIHDRSPAGILTVRGECFTDHRNDVMTHIRDVVQRVGTQHPLKRIIDMVGNDTEAVFTFTDEQLTREIGDSLQFTFDGVLEYQYSSEESMLRVFWQR
jgi:hypothetical protein